MAPNKPFFDAATVLTAVTQSKGGQAQPTDVIMQEVQEEETFKRLILQLRTTLNVQDRIMGRIPYYKSFVASDLINFMCDKIGVQNR